MSSFEIAEQSTLSLYVQAGKTAISYKLVGENNLTSQGEKNISPILQYRDSMNRTPRTAVELRERLAGWPREVVRAGVLEALSGLGSDDALAPVLAHWLTDTVPGGEVPPMSEALCAGVWEALSLRRQ